MNTKKCKLCGSKNLTSYGSRPKAGIGKCEYCFCNDCNHFFTGEKK